MCSMRMLRFFVKFYELTLTQEKANVFYPQHLQVARPELVQSMFKIGWKAAELERMKLKSEIQRQQSELRQKRLENRLKMAKEGQGKQGEVKILKYTEMEADDEEIEDLEELLDKPVQGKKRKTMSLYSALGKDEFVTGSKDRKSRLNARQK